MAYAFWFAGDWLLGRLRQFSQDMKNNKFDLMLPVCKFGSFLVRPGPYSCTHVQQKLAVYM